MDIKKIIKINDLIASGRSGTPRNLANKLGVSERMLYLIIRYMKVELGAPIQYDRNKMRYYYSETGILIFKWQSKSVNNL